MQEQIDKKVHPKKLTPLIASYQEAKNFKLVQSVESMDNSRLQLDDQIIENQSNRTPEKQQKLSFDISNEQTSNFIEEKLLKKGTEQLKLPSINPSQTKIIQELYYHQLLHKKSRKSNIQKIQVNIMDLIRVFIIPLINFAANCFCIITQISYSYIDIDHLSSSHLHWLRIFDLITALIFIIETSYYIFLIPGKYLQKIFNFERLIELINIIELFYSFSSQKKITIIIIMRTFRSLRIRKIRAQFRITKFFVKRFLADRKSSDFYQSENYFDDDPISTFLYDAIINFICGIFLQTSIILAMNEILYFDGYAYNDESLDYIGAAYYVIVSFSTIGYGEIYPTKPASRILQIILLMANLTIMSNFFSHLLEQIFRMSAYDKTYNFENHIVIIGHIPESYLIRFLNELNEYYKIYGQVNHQFQFQKQTLQILFVRNEEPSNEIRDLMSYFSGDYQYETHLSYLRANINDSQCFFKLSIYIQGLNKLVFQIVEHYLLFRNLKKVISFQEIWKYLLSLGKQSSNLMKQIVFLFYKVHSNIQLHQINSLKELILFQLRKLMKQSWDFLLKIQVLQHLFNIQFQYVGNKQTIIIIIISRYQTILKNKLAQILFKIIILMACNRKSILSSWEIFLLAKHFKKLLKQSISVVFHLKNLKIHNQRQQMNILYPQQLLLLLNIKERIKQYLKRSLFLFQFHLSKNIQINPQNMIIQENDIAYVICENHIVAKKLSQITEKSSFSDENFLNCQFFMGSNEEGQDVISNWYQQCQRSKSIEESQNEFEQNVLRHFNSKKIFELTLNEIPSIKFSNHTIIMGIFTTLARMLSIIRRLSQRTVVFYTYQELDIERAKALTEEFQNVYILKAEYQNIQHISYLEIQNSYQVLIMSNNNDDHFQDFDAICQGRLILEYFNQTRFLLELREDDKIRFFTKNQQLRLNHSQNSPFLYPLFQQGSIHLSSSIYCLLSRCIFNANWINFANKFLTPDDQELQNSTENRQIQSYQLTEQVVKAFKYFGVLQYYLMENSPSVIGVGLIKFHMNSNYKKSFFQQIFMTESELDPEKVQLAGKLMGSRYILTNPSFFTPLDKQDILLAIGDLHKQQFQSRVEKFRNKKQLLNTKSQVSTNQKKQNLEIIHEEIQKSKQSSLTSERQPQLKPIRTIQIQQNQCEQEERSFTNEDELQDPIIFQYPNKNSIFSTIQNSDIQENELNNNSTIDQQNEDSRNSKLGLEISQQNMKKILNEAKQLNKQLQTPESFKYLKVAKKIQNYQNLERRIQMKNKIIDLIQKKAIFFEELEGFLKND